MKYNLIPISKTTDFDFRFNPAFNSTMQFGTLPTILSQWDSQSGFTIQGTKIEESWNTYMFNLVATEQSSGSQNRDFMFDV